MELLIVLLLAPSVIVAQRYQTNVRPTSSNPNDEPFLPIYPLYPYNPKLIKRGTERDVAGHLTPELYAPKVDARDSYTASFAGNYQRDPYYPSYNPYPKSSTSTNYVTAGSLHGAGYGGEAYPAGATFAQPNAYGTVNTPYNAAGYANPNAYSPYAGGTTYSGPYPYSQAAYPGVYNAYSTPYAGGPGPYPGNHYPTGAYPYNYQAPYYYPNYYNQQYPVPPPPPTSQRNGQEGSSSEEETSSENETSGKTGAKKTEVRRNKFKEESDSAEIKDEQFVDGGNYLTSGSKDLDGQPSTYKTPSPYNQVEQLSDVRLRSVPVQGVPRTTYRVISVGGQPVGPDYPLPTTYAKVQQLEQLMSQALAKLLAQNTGNQAGQFQYQSGQQADSFEGQANKEAQRVIAKTGLGYLVNSGNLAKISSSDPGQFFGGYGNRQNPLLVKVPEPPNQGSTVLTKAAAKFADGPFGQKTVTTVSLQQAPGIYIPPEAKTEKDDGPQPSEYNDYESQPGQPNYDGPIAPNGAYKKNEQNYPIDQAQGNLPYHSSNLVTVQTPQAQSYQYSSYLPTQSTQQQQQPRDYKTSLDDVNFSTKRNSKA